MNTKKIPAGCRSEAAILYTPRKVCRYLGGKQARYHLLSWRPRYFPLSVWVSIIFRTWSTRSNLWRMSNSGTINNYYSNSNVLAGKGAMICWYLTKTWIFIIIYYFVLHSNSYIFTHYNKVCHPNCKSSISPDCLFYDKVMDLGETPPNPANYFTLTEFYGLTCVRTKVKHTLTFC